MTLQFYSAFVETMLHSLWQSALLMFFYKLVASFTKNMHPLQKRNLLFNILCFQFLVSVICFFTIFFSGNSALFSISTQFSLGILSNNEIISSILFYVYFIVFVYKFSKIVYDYYLKNKKRVFINPSLDIKLFTKHKALEIGIKQNVKIWFTKNIVTATVYGFFKPVILLPFAMQNQLSIKETEAIILHELTHIKQNDYLQNIALLILESVYFFNPIALSLISKIKIEREKSCDIQVVNFKYPPHLYADALYKLGNFANKSQIQLGAVGKRKHLLERIQFFSNYSVMEKLRFGSNIFFNLFLFVFSGFLVLIGNIKSVNDNSLKFEDVQENLIAKKYFGANNIEQTASLFTEVPRQENTKTKSSFKSKINSNTLKNKTNVGNASNLVKSVNVENIYGHTASFNEINDESVKQIIITQLDTLGKERLMLINIAIENGRYVASPILKLEKYKVNIDTLGNATDSSDSYELWQ